MQKIIFQILGKIFFVSCLEEAQKRVAELQEELNKELAEKDESSTQEEESKGGQ